MPADPALERLANATLLVPFPGTHPPGWLLDGLANGIAGVCLFHNNLAGAAQLRELTGQLRAAGGDPLISLDEEGGDVTRIGKAAGSEFPGNAALGAVDDPELTRRTLFALGSELAGLRVNLDLAPAVDVNTEPDNPVIGTRSFGADPGLVARHAAAAVTGLQEAGVSACAKHFPGHGSTRQDSHAELPVVAADLDLLRGRDLPPFAAAIGAGVRAVLTAHIQLPALGVDEPATLSGRVITGLLRQELGFGGVVISDALEMRGVSAGIGVPEAAVRALRAGCDLLCLGRYVYREGIDAVRTALTAAVAEGSLSAARLEEAAARTTELRARSASSGGSTPVAPPGATAIGLAGARRAVEVAGPLPALPDPLIVQVGAAESAAVGEVPWGLAPWFPDTRRIDASSAPAGQAAGEVAAAARGRGLVAVVRDAHRHPAVRELIAALCRLRPDAVVVEMGLPSWRPDCRAYIRTFGAARVNAQSAAEVLFSAVGG